LATLSLLELKPLLNHDVEIYITSPVPPGASMGTSATVSVALIKAVGSLLTKEGIRALAPAEEALLAHRAETEVMRGESGTQDQWSAAFSHGAQFITISPFPQTELEQINLSPKTVHQLESGLITIFVGSHNSSHVHTTVIKKLTNKKGDSPLLERLRQLAIDAKDTLSKGKLQDYGRILSANTETQRSLHLDLVGPDHLKILRLAHTLPGYLGGKVNGAGGGGGSVTLLFESKAAATRFFHLANETHKKEEYLYYEHKIAGA
jgi:D-glycero-alpha-D-manno-heptose-7-phosphate kinase